jgi:hypothetical protein
MSSVRGGQVKTPVSPQAVRSAPRAVRVAIFGQRKPLTKLTRYDWFLVACAVAKLRRASPNALCSIRRHQLDAALIVARLCDAQQDFRRLEYERQPAARALTRIDWFEIACAVAPIRPGIIRSVMDQAIAAEAAKPPRRRGAPEKYPEAEMRAVVELFERHRPRSDADLLRGWAKSDSGRSPETIRKFSRLLAHFRRRLAQ